MYDNGHGHCFACHHHKFPTVFTPKIEKPYGPKSLFPSDFTREVPTSAYVWLLQYGLPYSYWKPYTGYSEEAGKRLVFTVGQPVQFTIGRTLESEGKRKWFVWGDCHRHCEALGDGGTIVLVEDLISAHKVAAAGFISIPLFGTKVHAAHYYYLTHTPLPVVLWLDKDQEQNVKKQALQIESIIDRPVKIVTTDKDPKGLSFEAIRSATA